MGIDEFITARLDVTHAIASAAKWKNWVPGSGLSPASVETSEPQPGWHGERATVARLLATVGKVEREREHARHIAHHDPAQILRDVAAKRAILAEYTARNSDVDLMLGPDVLRQREWSGLYLAVRILAAIDEKHPDYNPKWRLA